MKQLNSIALSLSLLLAVLLVACGEDRSEDVLNARPVQYMVVEHSLAGQQRTFSGKVEAGYEATLSFKVAGTLTQRPVNVGDVVQGGQLLAALDERDYQIAVEQAQAALDLAQAQYRNAQADYERTKSLYENRNASKNDLDASRAGAESRKAQVESAVAQFDAAQLQLSYTQIYSPGVCQIAAVYFESNENIGAGQPFARINCGECPQVIVAVPETVIGQIKTHDQVKVRAQALPGQVFSAVVKEVGVATGMMSATYPVRVVLNESCPDLRSGMAADVEFHFANNNTAQDNMLLVPPVAVNEDRDGKFVFVLTPLEGYENYWVANRRAVEIGPVSRVGIAVTEGLAPGDYVVTAGVKQLVDQEVVTLLKTVY